MARPAARLRRRRRASTPRSARELARAAAQSLGYASLWSNDHPMASGLETAARVRGRPRPALDVGVAVLALDRHSPPDVAAQDRRGSASTRPPVGRHRRRLHQDARSDRRARGARGDAGRAARRAPGSPSRRWGRRCAALAGAEADGVFLNWMTPDTGGLGARADRTRGARSRPRRGRPWCFGYVRVAVGADAARAAAQGGVLLPRPAPGLHPPLRGARRAARHGRVAARDPAEVRPRWPSTRRNRPRRRARARACRRRLARCRRRGRGSPDRLDGCRRFPSGGAGRTSAQVSAQTPPSALIGRRHHRRRSTGNTQNKEVPHGSRRVRPRSACAHGRDPAGGHDLVSTCRTRNRHDLLFPRSRSRT